MQAVTRSNISVNQTFSAVLDGYPTISLTFAGKVSLVGIPALTTPQTSMVTDPKKFKIRYYRML